MFKAIDELKTNAFTKCIEPLMIDFIQSKVIDPLREEEKQTIFLAYGNFPGNKRFADLLWNALYRELGAITVAPVDSCATIGRFIRENIDPNPKDFRGKIIWFPIRNFEYSMVPDAFSPLLSSRNRDIWFDIQHPKDKTVGIVVTYECGSTALHRYDAYWDYGRFDQQGLWRIVEAGFDFGMIVAGDIKYRLTKDRNHIEPLESYYKKLRKMVLSYARSQLKHRCIHFALGCEEPEIIWKGSKIE